MSLKFYKGESINLLFKGETDLSGYHKKVKIFTPFSTILEKDVTSISNNSFSIFISPAETSSFPPGSLNIVLVLTSKTDSDIVRIGKAIPAILLDADKINCMTPLGTNDTNIEISIGTEDINVDIDAGNFIVLIDGADVEPYIREAVDASRQAQAAATTAAISAANASTSETNVGNSATAAETSKTEAQTAKTAAEAAKTEAETAATIASTAATKAETAATKAEDIANTIGEKTNPIVISSSDDNSSYNLIDQSGNIGFRIDSNGYSMFIQLLSNLVSNLERVGLSFDSNNQVVIEKGTTLSDVQIGSINYTISKILDLVDPEFNIVDNKGNIGLKVDSNGLAYFSQNITNLIYNLKRVGFEFDEDNQVVEKSAHWMLNLKMYTVGDSLGAGGVWQNKLAELSGCLFSGNYSIGGTRSIGNNGGMERLLAMKAAQVSPDIIIYENINDYWGVWTIAQKGAISDASWMLSQVLLSSSVYSSSPLATSGLMSEVGAITPSNRKVGSLMKLQYTSSISKVISINNAPTSDGSIVITLDGSNYSISITAGMTVSQVVAKIVEVSYNGYTITSTSSSVTFVKSAGTIIISVDPGTTGITLSISDGTSTTSYLRYAFISRDISNWENSSYWVLETDITMYSVYKGIIEFLQTNYPSAFILFFIPTRFQIAYTATHAGYKSSYWNTDGTFNMSSYTSNFSDYQNYMNLVSVQKEVCDLYGVRSIDCNKLSGISPFNLSVYYNDYDVHPKAPGYNKWAETIFRNI